MIKHTQTIWVCLTILWAWRLKGKTLINIYGGDLGKNNDINALTGLNMNSVFQNKPLMRKYQIQLLAYSTFVSMKNTKRLLKLHLLTDSNSKYQGLISWVKWVSSDTMLSENGLLLTTSFLSFRRKQFFADVLQSRCSYESPEAATQRCF